MKKRIKSFLETVLWICLLLSVLTGCENSLAGGQDTSDNGSSSAETDTLTGGERFPLDNGYIEDGTVYTYEDFEYGMVDGLVTILKYKGDAENVVVPSKINGIPVARLFTGVFRDNKTVVTVTLPESITEIPMTVFQDCTSLVSVNLPNSITYIGDLAFYNCTSLTSVVLPKRLEMLGHSAFYGCTSLTSITIPNTIDMDMNPEQFQYTFANCTALQEVMFEEGATTIGFGSNFMGCTALTSITFPSGVTYIPEKYLEGCTALTSVTIPDSVINIGSDAFSNTGLESVVIPENVQYLSTAFQNCPSLTSMKFEGDAPVKFEENFFSSLNPELILYYHRDTKGWTSPTFQGLSTEIW